MRLFPYAPRPQQAELVATLQRALLAGGHAVVESGTGTGKTVCALSAALDVARVRGLRVLYLTRTNSQARQVMVEYRAIRAAQDINPAACAVALQGRAHLCPLRRDDEEMAQADADELGVMCRDRMQAAQRALEGEKTRLAPCKYHLRGLEVGSEDLLEWARAQAPDAETFGARVVGEGQCPYVLSRALLADAELVVAPYVYFFHAPLRAALLRWLGAIPEDLLVVVDEAHNLPDYARELSTPRLGSRSVELALAEARQYGDPVVLGTTSLGAFLRGVQALLDEARDTYLADDAEDALLPPDEWDVMLLSRFRTSTTGLDKALTVMEEYAEAVRASRRRQGKVPRSHVGSVAAFLRAYRHLDPGTHVALVERTPGDGVRLVAFALDPSPVTDILAQTGGSVHVSGTLAPLEEYRDVLGLDPERTTLARFPSPFPPENRLVLVDDEVTTRHEDLAREPQMWGLIAQRLRDLRAATDRNVAVFVPSFDVLHRLAPALRSRGTLVEARGERQDDLMERLTRFKAGRGGTLVSVIGGRLSEGLDFPDEELEVVVIVGLPYGRPSAKSEALVRFYDRRFGRGWEWAVKVPMQRRLQQAAGRLIRSPTDRGVLVILDRRASMLRDAFPSAIATSHPASLLRGFFAANISYGGAPFSETRNPSGPPSRRPGA